MKLLWGDFENMKKLKIENFFRWKCINISSSSNIHSHQNFGLIFPYSTVHSVRFLYIFMLLIRIARLKHQIVQHISNISLFLFFIWSFTFLYFFTRINFCFWWTVSFLCQLKSYIGISGTISRQLADSSLLVLKLSRPS